MQRETMLENVCDSLTEQQVAILLCEQGYELVCRFGHVHAQKGAHQELHICLHSDLAVLNEDAFLRLFDASLKQSLQYRLPFVQQLSEQRDR